MILTVSSAASDFFPAILMSGLGWLRLCVPSLFQQRRMEAFKHRLMLLIWHTLHVVSFDAIIIKLYMSEGILV